MSHTLRNALQPILILSELEGECDREEYRDRCVEAVKALASRKDAILVEAQGVETVRDFLEGHALVMRQAGAFTTGAGRAIQVYIDALRRNGKDEEIRYMLVMGRAKRGR